MLDMQADFDIVLGMSWFQEWDPAPNWKKLEFTVETQDGIKHIRRLPQKMDLQHLDELREMEEELNLMSEKELAQGLKVRE